MVQKGHPTLLCLCPTRQITTSCPLTQLLPTNLPTVPLVEVLEAQEQRQLPVVNHWQSSMDEHEGCVQRDETSVFEQNNEAAPSIYITV